MAALVTKKRDRRMTRAANKWDSCLLHLDNSLMARIDERMKIENWSGSRSAWLRRTIEEELAGEPDNERELEYVARSNATTRLIVRLEVGSMARVDNRMVEEGIHSLRQRSAWIRDVIGKRLG